MQQPIEDNHEIDESWQRNVGIGPLWIREMITGMYAGQVEPADAIMFIGEVWRDMAPYCESYKHTGQPWSALAVAWAFTRAHVRPPKDKFLDPEAWRRWGFDVKSYELGAVACTENQVGLCYESTDNQLYMVSTNDAGAIAIVAVPLANVMAYRWPAPEDYRTGYYPDDDRK